MESKLAPKPLTFGALEARLIQKLKFKLNDGEFTERGLARLTGISQPQVHNLLKGARRLNSDSADIFLEALDLSVRDLLGDAEPSSDHLIAIPAEALSSKSNPPVPSQLALQFEPEAPRKNPASSPTTQLDRKKQAS